MPCIYEYNADEIGFAIVNKIDKIIYPKGSKSVIIKTGWRIKNITLVVRCNSTRARSIQ
jgi:hypothetical protein